jgi:acyl-homoserine-lactone acylase
MADDYVTVEAQRSRYFGPAGTYLRRAAGPAGNLDSDLSYQQIIDSRVIGQLTARG